MNSQYHTADAKGRTMVGGVFTAILKDPNQIHPDEPGAKDPTYFLRYSFLIPDPQNGEGAVREVPELAMIVPRYIAHERVMNREGKFITEEEAKPLLDAQNEIAKQEAKAAREYADRFLEEKKREMGEIPDVVDSESAAKIAALETQLTEQGAKLDAILKALTPPQ